MSLLTNAALPGGISKGPTRIVSDEKKHGQECEIWQYHDRCVPKNVLTHCNDYNQMTGNVCGEELKYATAGGSHVIHESADATITRHYIKKVN